MWRSRSSEEWERTKSYLVRSLFEDIPVLSPISEGHEPVSLSSPSNLVNRSESPLPELIIELEPKKPNLHDDPEELYEALAKEMRRLYRKDFLNIELSISSSKNSRSESLDDEIIYDNVTSDSSNNEEVLDETVLKYSQIEYDATKHQLNDDIDCSRQKDTSTSKESSETLHIVSESSMIQVDVHSRAYVMEKNLAQEQQGFRESKQYRLSGEDSINVSKTTNVIESIQVENDDSDTEKRSDSESFAKDTNASSSDSSDSSINSSHASPEIMRQRQRSASFKTPQHYPASESNSTLSKTIHFSMEADSKEFSEDVLASNEEIEIAEDSVNETSLFVTSTSTRKRSSSRLSTTEGHKRRLVSYSSSSSFASIANAALQTSFSDCGNDWSCFWSNFFVGMPTVYNVCSCNDHVCTT